MSEVTFCSEDNDCFVLEIIVDLSCIFANAGVDSDRSYSGRFDSGLNSDKLSSVSGSLGSLCCDCITDCYSSGSKISEFAVFSINACVIIGTLVITFLEILAINCRYWAYLGNSCCLKMIHLICEAVWTCQIFKVIKISSFIKRFEGNT